MAGSRFLAAAICAALLASALNAGAESSPEKLGRMIDQAVAGVPPCVGLAIGVTQGNVRTQRFYGDAGNHSPPRADTLFGIGSITKTLTATVLAFADQEGRMHLDDPLARYAPPGFRVPEFNGQPILLAHLAQHTSGLPRMVPDPASPMPPERLWRFTSNYQLPHAPGEQFLYSNLGFALLARAMVRQLNASEDELYARIITGPLGLHDTAIELTAAQRTRLAEGFRANGQPAPEFGPGFPAMAGAGAARSTLNDMMRYLDFELGQRPRLADERWPTWQSHFQGRRHARLCLLYGVCADAGDRRGGPVKPGEVHSTKDRRTDHARAERGRRAGLAALPQQRVKSPGHR
jgi:D-alanyl-D-alanine-carboxypeptidase/D-alanyl-D-alanine-endopeptidase